MSPPRGHSGRGGRAVSAGPPHAGFGDSRIKLARAGVALIALLLLVACATDTHPYRYRPAIPVTTSDWRTCHARADAKAQRGYERYLEMVDLAGPFGGPFGGASLGRRAWEEREAVYEREVIECLTARGYDLRPETAPSR